MRTKKYPNGTTWTGSSSLRLPTPEEFAFEAARINASSRRLKRYMLIIVLLPLAFLQFYYVSILYNQLRQFTYQSQLSAIYGMKVTKFLVHNECQ